MLAAYITAVAVTVASLAVGSALCRAAAVRPKAWLSPAVGLAALLVAARVTIGLPGAGVTSLVLLAALVVLCAGLAWWGERYRIWPGLREGAPTAAVALAAASLPFIASGRYGLLGPTVNGDPAFHLVWIDRLREGMTPLTIAPGYPVAPHSLVATVAQATRDPAGSFTGLLLAVPVLTALTARGFLPDLGSGLRAAAAALVALPYLAASYLAQASYKEPIEALIVLGVAATARELGLGLTRRVVTVVLLALFVLASIGTHGTGGAVWPLAVLATWAAAELMARRRLPRLSRTEWRALAFAAAVAVVIGGVLVLRTPQSVLGDILSSASEGGPAGGNLISPLSPFEGLGIWLSNDFRVPAPNPGYTAALDGLAVAVAVFSLWWWVRRRELAVPAAAVGAALVYVLLTQRSSVYFAAKGLAVLAPAWMLLLLRPLLAGMRWPIPFDAFSIGRLAVAATFAASAAGSSLLALRGATVDDGAHLGDLARFASRVARQPTLFLGTDAYAAYELRRSQRR
jgi:hypothetical protein